MDRKKKEKRTEGRDEASWGNKNNHWRTALTVIITTTIIIQILSDGPFSSVLLTMTAGQFPTPVRVVPYAGSCNNDNRSGSPPVPNRPFPFGDGGLVLLFPFRVGVLEPRSDKMK